MIGYYCLNKGLKLNMSKYYRINNSFIYRQGDLMNENLLKPIIEASYLTANNTWRYRAILRFFYEQHERLRHYLVLEEIYDYLKKNPYFQDYTEDQLQQDLDQLVSWKNLIPRQDMGRVTTIEEFKKRKFRYQLTPYTIEFERMIIGLEKMGEGYGGSLERTLFDRLLANLMKLTEVSKDGDSTSFLIFKQSNEQIHLLWKEDIFDNFRKLTENATDYLAHLQSEKVEAQMMTEAFLVFKESLTEYLRNFMTSLQRVSFRIESLLQEVPQTFVTKLSDCLAEYELSIPRLDTSLTKEQLAERYINEWNSLKTWFLGDNTRESDLTYLQNATNEAIRRLTRFAQRLGENRHSLRNRRMDYLHLAKWFLNLDSLEEAHKLSACVFGVAHTRHLYVDQPKKTESYDVEIWNEPPAEVTIRPKIRTYQEKTRPNAIIDQTARKKAALEAYLAEKAQEQQLMEELIKGDRLEIKNLSEVTPFIRKTILSWIAKSMAHPERKGKTENGRVYRLEKISDQRIILKAEDGELEMPDYVLIFEK